MQNDDVKKPFGQIEQYLASYQVPYPSEDEISDTIETLRQYVPSKRKLLVTRYKTFRRIFVDMLITINFMSVSYWIITILLFTIGYLSAVQFSQNPYKLSFVFAPIPMTFGLIEVFRGREEGVTELELSCKISPQEMLITRIIVIGIYTAVLNASLCGFVFLHGQANVILWRITLLWLTPMDLIGSITLWFCSRIKGTYSVMLSLFCWSGASYVFVTNEGLFRNFLYLNPLCYLIPLFIGIGIFVKEIIKLKDRYIFEGRNSSWN
ncbi:hypothetical protein [Ethanoligenens harbinense]|uniref:Uncharacterized protein n=1 Tax=Ethanoligenens harbinense (strain DSM 18485 / JCM 12961 / CGMCC 1.5033 / YUAN-3) TaxID=663278 RepID=E6U944_ETHHY|nr:hypothetical protein [Ethanoligenens harbinense]ADU26108.1 hypothetical protein Ethha_0526 [Ethanoligenens harbinense YUAN-3]AVQ95253.1 hypothetical protein CXQ68_02730 [Ethanoligenens harbinense YUAN-3]AYF40664.1 hypothetical protein CN246_02730 [Ethanoligenens harbinense]QCN91498.1 hypothetical protein DRA42_02740 [Ethanoligenens harbinense]